MASSNHPKCELSSETNQSSMIIKYKECRRNHAISVGGHAIDGCREFTAGGEQGTEMAFLCVACGCHRSFHRKEIINNGVVQRAPTPPVVPPYFVPPLVPMGLATYNKPTLPYVVLHPVDYSLSQPHAGLSSRYYHHHHHDQPPPPPPPTLPQSDHDQHGLALDGDQDVEQKPNTKMEPF